MIPRDVKSPTVADPLPQAAQGRRDRRRRPTRRPRSCSTRSPPRTSKSRSPTASTATSPRMPSVGAYIALGRRRPPRRRAQPRRAVRAIGFPHAALGAGRFPPASPTWPSLEHDRARSTATSTSASRPRPSTPSRSSPACINYGKTLLPPFFGGLMAYDGEANIAFDCPGHQGGQFYRKSPAGQLFFKHFGESIFRNDLCNADVDLGDLLIHEGPAAEAQKLCRAGLRRRQDLLRAERHQHLQQGRDERGAAARRPRPLRPQQSQIAASGRAGAGRRDSDLPADRAQRLRHDRRRRLGRLGRGLPARADPRQSARQGQGAGTRPSGPSASPASSSRPMTARSTTCARCWRRSATFATTSSGTRRGSATTPSTRCSRTTARCGSRGSGRRCPGLFSTQSVHKQGAGFSQASQIHKRDEHIRGQRRFIEHKRFNESFLMHASTSPFYPLFASLDVNAKVHEGKAGEMLWDRCIELGIEVRKKLREFGRYYERTGRDTRGALVLRSLRAGRGDDPRFEVHRGPRPTFPGRTFRPRSSSANSSAGTSGPKTAGTAMPATPTATRWSTRTSSLC